MGDRLFIFSILLYATKLLFKIAILIYIPQGKHVFQFFHMPQYLHDKSVYQSDGLKSDILVKFVFSQW